MASPLEEEVEIDLRAGIYANESLFAIGSRLAEAQNAVYGWRYPQYDDSFATAAPPPHLLRVPTYFPPRTAITYGSTPRMFLDIGFSQNSAAAKKKIIIGTTGVDDFRAWEAETGTLINLAGGVTSSTITFTADPFPATSAYWPTPGAGVNITGPALFFTHREATNIYYILDSGTTIRSMNNDGITNTPAGGASLCVHLSRLWIARSGTPNAFNSLITYTDPFDAETIRGTNFVSIPDIVNVILPSTPGEIDAAGVPHLFVVCANSIWMVDGDPTTTQALRRQIAESVGVASPMGVCITPLGPAFIATDNQVYLCPPDGRNLQPIGDAIRNYLNNPIYTGSSSRACIAWFSPYLYLFPTGSTAISFVCDLTNPQRPTWWGPMANAVSTPSISVIKSAPSGYSIHAPSFTTSTATPSIWTAGKLTTSTGEFLGFDRLTKARGTFPHGHEQARQQRLSTGYFVREGHRVQMVRVTLDTSTKDATYVWGVSVQNDRGTTSTAVLSSSTPVTTSGGAVKRQLYTFPDGATAVANELRLIVNGPAASQGTASQSMGLQRLRCRVRYIPVSV